MSAPTQAPGVHRKPSNRRPRLFTIVLLVVVAWLAIGGIGGPLFGQLSSVQENDNSAFLPASAESTRALELQQKFADQGGGSALPVTVAFERQDGGTIGPVEVQAMLRAVQRAVSTGMAAETVKRIDFAGQSLPLVFPATAEQAQGALSRDREAFVAVITLDLDKVRALGGFEAITEVIDEISAAVQNPSPGIAAYVTGPGGFFAELGRAFGDIDGRLLRTTLTVVAIILLIVYRSPFLWVLPLFSALLALSLSIIAVYHLAKNGILDLNGQSQGILFVLVLGAATDYSLLLIARYREELTRHASKYVAMRAALRGAWEPIAASAGTCIAGLLCLMLSDLSSIASMGPVAAVGIAAAFIASLTFLPASLLLFGRKLFWPFIPHLGSEVIGTKGIWAKVSGLVGRRPNWSWVSVTLLLVIAAGFTTTLKADGLDNEDTFVNQNNPAVVGLRVLERHDLVAPTPDVTIVTPVESAGAVRSAAGAVGSVELATLRPAPGGEPGSAPIVAEGLTLVDVTFVGGLSNEQRQQTVRDLRSAMDFVESTALVGGRAAIDLDVQDASRRDRLVIIPTVLVVITIILAMLLRSILAPILLLGTVVLSFAATLGICALLFNNVFGFAGADASFPLFAFVFLVALGIDYNIFLMTRVREESLKIGTRQGTLVALAVTGGVITSAGIVLAATFSALAVIPIVFLAQIGVAVALGVLIDTFIVRSILVPALVYKIGPAVWWPSALAKQPEPEPERELQPV
jgi:putative drug exporter of the RND superfamily